MKPEQLQAHYERACEDILRKVTDTVAESGGPVCILQYHKVPAICTYRRRENRVEALYANKGRLRVIIRGNLDLPASAVRFTSLKDLVDNVTAAIRFPDRLREKAETFYGKPLTLYGQPLTVTGYIQRNNGPDGKDTYVFSTDDGEPIALTKQEIIHLAKKTTP